MKALGLKSRLIIAYGLIYSRRIIKKGGENGYPLKWIGTEKDGQDHRTLGEGLFEIPEGGGLAKELPGDIALWAWY